MLMLDQHSGRMLQLKVSNSSFTFVVEVHSQADVCYSIRKGLLIEEMFLRGLPVRLCSHMS